MNHKYEKEGVPFPASTTSHVRCDASGAAQHIPRMQSGLAVVDTVAPIVTGGFPPALADRCEVDASNASQLSERLSQWLREVHKEKSPGVQDAPFMPSDRDVAPRSATITVDGAALAAHLGAEAAALVKSEFVCKDAAPGVSSVPFVLVRHCFADFEIDLTLAIAGITGAYPKPIRGDLSHERAAEQGLAISYQMNTPTPGQLVGLLGRQIAIVLVVEERQVLPQEIQGLVSRELHLEPFNGASLSSACRALYRIAATADLSDEVWMRGVQPGDFLLTMWTPPPTTTPAQALDMIGGWLKLRVQGRRQMVPAESFARLDELEGVDAARRWATELIDDIRLATLGPERGGIAWSQVDRGALLAGPTGTGKTTLARAIAHASGLPFVVASAAAWAASGRLNEHLVAIRETFSEIQAAAPAILFIDEIDSLGSRAGLGSDGNAQYVREVINCVLEQLDGFHRRGQVIVLAATNDITAVDPALRRAGRLDRIIAVPHPDASARARILRRYLSGQQHSVSTEEFELLGRASVGLTGADIEQVVRTASRRARRDKARLIHTDDLRRLILRLPEISEQRPVDPSLLHRICVHEAGHALLTLLGGDGGKSLQHVSTVSPTEDTGGFVLCLPDIAWAMASGDCLLDQMCAALAGRAAEAVIFGENNIGIGSGGADPDCDLATATKLAGAYVSQYGFSRSGTLVWRQKLPAQDAWLTAEVEMILREQYDRAAALLARHRSVLDAIAAALTVRLDMSGDEVRQIARTAGLDVAANDSRWLPGARIAG